MLILMGMEIYQNNSLYIINEGVYLGFRLILRAILILIINYFLLPYKRILFYNNYFAHD